MAFLLHDIRLQKIRPLWWTTTYISPKAKTIQSSVLTHFTSGVTNVTVRIDIKNKTKKEFKLNLQTGVCTWFDLWSSQVTMGSSPVWTCISIHFSGTLLKKVWVYMRELSDIKVGHHDVESWTDRWCAWLCTATNKKLVTFLFWTATKTNYISMLKVCSSARMGQNFND